jgi:hypothetical protein
VKFQIKILLLVVTFNLKNVATAQLPFEIFAGNKKATADLMFFKFIKNKQQQNTKWLFFNRNRASIDYQQTSTINLPQFGFTEAISFNDAKLKGFSPVAVVSILNKGVYSKVGFQFVKIKTNFTLFSWVVVETLKNANVDFFFLGRYTPKLSNTLNLYTQMELLNTFPTVMENNFSLTQRFRLGLKIKEFQFGLGADFNEIGRNNFIASDNFGSFIRYEF